MIKLEKIKNSKSNGYFYHPENTADVGMIEIKGDEVVGVPYYANKARAEVLRLLKAGQLVDEKLLAWY